MNIRKIVTYNNLRRQFTPEELAFADQLYSATESEKELIVESLQPQKPTAKKSSKKTGKKSARQQSIGEQIQRRTRPVVSHGGQYCIAQIDDNGGLMECGEVADHNVHHKQGDSDYHPFTPAASSAPPLSPPSAKDDSYGVNSGIDSDAAGAVAGGSNG